MLIPAYNAEATLAAALRSVERQTERDWECLVVDDGSQDGTAAVASALAGSDSRFRVFRLSHGGIVSALNAGAELCRGELVARLDADDLMARRRHVPGQDRRDASVSRR